MLITIAGKVIEYPTQQEDYQNAKVLASLGMKYEGIQSQRLVVFTDPQTKSTLAIDCHNFSREAVIEKVEKSRKAFER